MTKSHRPKNIPLNKLATITDRQFMLRSKDDGVNHQPHNHFHRDDYFMIGVVVAGSFHLSIDFQDIALSEGEAIIISPGQVHSASENIDVNGFVLALAPELLTDRDLTHIRQHVIMQKPIKLPATDFADIKSLYEIMKRRINRHGSAEISLATAVKNIVIENIPTGSNISLSRYTRLVTGLQSLMERSIATEKRPSAYAKMLNVSGVYLNEAVHAITGKSVSSFIGEYIATLAKRDLCHTNLTAHEIASKLGFNDYSYFSRMFKRHAGVSPKAFRSRNLE